MRKTLFTTLAAAVVAASACGGGDSTTGPVSASVAGTYALQTVNSAPLPFTMPDDGSIKIEILADSYTLADNGKYTNVTQVRLTMNGVAAVENLESQGTYTRAGNTVTLTDSEDATDKVTATLNGATMTVTAEGFVLVYQRSGS